jgi:heme-degrading monooxygenase HmoA
MIVRTWRGRAPTANPLSYVRHFRQNVLPQLRKLDGFLGALLLREDQADAVEYLVLTKWASMDAVRAFAGADVSRAVVEPEAAAALMSFDPTVHHYEVVEDATDEKRP